MDYKIVIPSFNRVDILKKKTYKLLTDYNVNEKDIYLFIVPEEIDKYKKEFPNANIIKTKKGFLEGKKYLLQYWKSGTKLITMDDDITKIVKLQGNKLVPIDNFNELAKKMFNEMKKSNTRLGGFYPVPNVMFMKNAPEITTDLRYIYGPFRFWIVDNNIIPTNNGKEDFEMTIEYYKKYGGVLRMNKFSFISDYMGGSGGRDRSTEKKDSDDFKKKYKEYISREITHKDGTTSFLLKKNVGK
jgi:hypothetical protein